METKKVVISKEDEKDLGRLMDSLPLMPIQHLETRGDKFILLSDLNELLIQLDRNSISDQKQEAFRGLRQYLYILTRNQ